jgi:phosphomevalonate kinase
MADKIIIFSGKQYSGKDTAAKILMESLPSFKRCAMGDIIKIEYGKINKLTYDEIENNKAHYRQGLIDLGNWGRSQSPDYWLKKIIAQEGNIVVTDVRIKHEYTTFKNAGAITIRVEANREIREARGGKLIGEDDVTEVDLDDIQDWDFLIDNNKDYETLKQEVLKIVEKIN